MNATNLSHLPERPSQRHKLLSQLDDTLVKTSGAEVTTADDAEDLIDGVVGGQRTVEDGELALESLGDVVTAAAGLDHGGEELDVHDVGEVAGLLQAVHARHLHHLARDLVGNLKFYDYHYLSYVAIFFLFYIFRLT